MALLYEISDLNYGIIPTETCDIHVTHTHTHTHTHTI